MHSHASLADRKVSVEATLIGVGCSESRARYVRLLRKATCCSQSAAHAAWASKISTDCQSRPRNSACPAAREPVANLRRWRASAFQLL